MGFDFGKNKDTMKLLTLGSVIGAAVYTGWTMIALIVISITHKAYSAMIGLCIFIGILEVVALIATLVLHILTREYTSSKWWMFIQVGISSSLFCVVLSLIIAKFSLGATFAFTIIGLCCILLALILVKKHMSDESVGPSSGGYTVDTTADGDIDYKPPAAVDSEGPAISEMPPDTQQTAYASDSAAVL